MGGQTSKSLVLIDGHCDEKYKPVKAHLEHMLTHGAEENVQLCVYVEGQCVIDLYGTAIGDNTYNADTIQTIYSSGKSIESIIMAMFHSKGLFQYEDKVAKHWPEFGQNGKESISISDVFRHEAGLAWFTESIPSIQNALTSNIKLNQIGEFIEKQSLHFPPNGKVEYHAQTRGLIVNELVRRLDSKGRTIGDILKEDIKIPGIYLGQGSPKPAKQTMITKAFVIAQSLIPESMGKKLNVDFFDTVKKVFAAKSSISRIAKQPPLFEEMKGLGLGQKFIDFYNSEASESEIPSVNFKANARGCALLASKMANKGQDLMSEKSWQEMHSEHKYAPFGLTSSKAGLFHYNFTKGGVNYFENSPSEATDLDKNMINKNRQGYYGWFGYGGSIMQWHPRLKIGFAFIPTFLNTTEPFNNRGAVLQQKVKECAEK